MPVVHFPVSGTRTTLFLPAFFKIIDELTNAIDIEVSSRIILNNNINVTPTDNKSNISNLEKDNLPTTVSKRRLVININNDFNEDALATTATYQFENSFIFKDHDIQVFLYFIYLKTDVEFEFNYFTPSLSEANKLRDQLRIAMSRVRNILHHEIEYDIIIPEQIEDFLADVHENKSRLFNISLEEYIRTHFTKRLHLVTDMSNKENARLAIREKQIRIIGTFDFILPEKIEIDNETNNYKLGFNYKFSFDAPKAIVVRYPVMVCNRPLKAKYLKFIEDYKKNSLEEYKKELSYSYSLGSLSIFEAHRQLENRLDIKLPINIPMFDDYNERSIHKGYAILFSFLVSIDEEDKRTLLNLNDLGDYILDPLLLKFIKEVEREYITQPYQSFIYLGLQQDDTYFDMNILEVTENLQVKSKVDLDLVKPTRVLLSIALDFSMLNEEAIKRLLIYNSTSEYSGILILLLKEHLNAIQNFITEFFITVDPKSFFLRNYILLLFELYKKDNKSLIEEIMNAFKLNKLIYNEIINILRDNYKEIYDYLYQNNFIDIHYLFDTKQYRDSINTGIRTVQTSYILALRKEDLNK